VRRKKNIINLFKDEKTYNIKHVISISDEEDLNQSWDYISTANTEKRELTQTFLAQFYNLVLSYIMKKKLSFFEVILEDSDDYLYFTLWNEKMSLLFKKYAKKASLDFLYDDKRISIRLDKKAYYEKRKKIEKKNEKREKNLIKSVNSEKKKVKKPAYTFIEHDDLNELRELNDDMIEFIIQTSKYGFSHDLFISLRSTLSIFCQILRYYDRITPFSTILTNFSNLLNVNKDRFIELNIDQLSLIKGFIYNIDYWLNTLFVNGGADLYFMDNSLNADYEMISQIISPPEANEENMDLDDIFDF